MSVPATYEIRVEGHLDEAWSDWFGPARLAHEPDGVTRLQAALPDQAALHGLLARVRDLGLPLVSLRRL